MPLSAGLPHRPARLRFLLATLLLGHASAQAELMTLTDILGRTIRAEPVAIDGGTIKIRREDGREFSIELKSLIDDDQERVKSAIETQAKADAAPAPTSDTDDKSNKSEKPKFTPDLAKLLLSLSRFKAETNTLEKFEGYTHKHEMWGYSFQVQNRNIHPVDKLRIEYNLFARTFSDSSTPSLVAGSIDLPAIGSSRSESAKTKTAEVCKRKGYYTYNNGGEVRGVWVKLYLGDKLVQEQISPDSLKNEVEWTPPSQAPRTPRVVGDGYVY